MENGTERRSVNDIYYIESSNKFSDKLIIYRDWNRNRDTIRIGRGNFLTYLFLVAALFIVVYQFAIKFILFVLFIILTLL